MPPPGAYPYYGPPPRRATFSSILSGMFDVWAKNFANFFLVFFVIGLVTAFVVVLLFYAVFGELAYFAPSQEVGPPPFVDTPKFALYVLLVDIASLILSSTVVGGMAEFAVRRFRAEAVPVEQTLRRGLQRFLSILGANLLLGLLVAGIVLVPLLLIVGTTLGPGADPVSALGLICLGVLVFTLGGLVVLFIIVGTSLWAPTVMMEDRNAFGGLMRSWQLTKGYRWSLFGALLVTAILVSVITAVITVPAGFSGYLMAEVLASALATGLVGAWFVILSAVAYDLIVRTPAYAPPPYMGPIGAPPGAVPPSGPSPPATPPTGP